MKKSHEKHHGGVAAAFLILVFNETVEAEIEKVRDPGFVFASKQRLQFTTIETEGIWLLFFFFLYVCLKMFQIIKLF